MEQLSTVMKTFHYLSSANCNYDNLLVYVDHFTFPHNIQ